MTSPVAEAKAVVESGGARRRLSFGLIGLIVLGVTLVATAHVAVHAKRIEVAIALGKEERASRELTLQRRHLEIEIGMLKDPARIIAIARDQLGMRPPAPANIHAGLANAGEAIRVASPPALPAANHRGREWEPSQGSHQP
jgi:cell division protein FtsL